MSQAIGFSRRGSRLGVFVNSATMNGYIGRELREKIENPLIFQLTGAAADVGHEASMLFAKHIGCGRLVR